MTRPLDIDDRVFRFIDAVISGDWDTAHRIAHELDQGDQMDMFDMIKQSESKEVRNGFYRNC